MSSLWTFVAFLVLLFTARLTVALRYPSPRNKRTQCKLAVFLGSGKFPFVDGHNLESDPLLGGHTSEALQMVSALDFTKYTPRTYIISEGDHLSAQKAQDLEALKGTSVRHLPILLCSRILSLLLNIEG
jgi:beta-1,4-N-acetylglucosaminyltransferase